MLTHMHNSVVPGHVRPRVNLQIVVEQHNRKLLKVKTAHNVANRFFQLDSHSQAQEKLLRLYTSSLRKTTETSTGCSRADAPAAGPLPGCHYQGTERGASAQATASRQRRSRTCPRLRSCRLVVCVSSRRTGKGSVSTSQASVCARVRVRQRRRENTAARELTAATHVSVCREQRSDSHDATRTRPTTQLWQRRTALKTTWACAGAAPAPSPACVPPLGAAQRVCLARRLRHIGTRHAVGPRSRVKVLSSDARVASRRRGWCQGPSTVKGPTLSRPQCAARLP